jgi:DNA-binding LytR/AlgR family response regulator
MKKTKVLIMEDQITEASFLKDTLIQLGYEVSAVASCLSEGLEYFSMYQPDISLVDVYFDGKPDGIMFCMEISAKQEAKRPFLFLTGATDTSTFKLAKAACPYNYLIKPFNKPELQYAIELAIERYQAEVSSYSAADIPTPTESVFVKRGNTLVSIQYNDIKYIEVDGKYSKIVCYNQKFVVQQPLGDLYASLPSKQFFRIHRRFVINIREIMKIDTQTHEIFFKDGNSLFFSRRYLDEFLTIFKFIK